MLDLDESMELEYYELMEKESIAEDECVNCSGCMRCYMMSWRDFI